jgi:hypothetical protein
MLLVQHQAHGHEFHRLLSSRVAGLDVSLEVKNHDGPILCCLSKS